MREHKINNKTKLLLLITVLWTVIYLSWRMFYTIPTSYGKLSFYLGCGLLVVEIIGLFESFVHYYNLYRIEEYEVPKVSDHEYPHVDVFVPTYNEPIELLYKTINGCVAMDYPDKNKVHIYLCDDSRRPEVKELAKKMGIHYITRQDNKGAKAGNLNNALKYSSSPLIATFDADMIPKHDFLMVMAAYFVDAKKKGIKLGFVQSPQSFYNPDLFQYNLFSERRIPNEQDYFYKDIQVSKNKSNSVIYGGSNTLLAREALEEVGGFYTETITEDFATGMLIQKAGYICYAVRTVLASGLSPTDFKSLLTQRVRWARGCIATGKKMHIITAKNLSFGQKINYLISIWYWYSPLKRLFYICVPIASAVFGVMVVKCTLLEVLIFYLPMHLLNRKLLDKLSNQMRNVSWTNVYETTLFPFMIIPVMLETFGLKAKKFKVTEKSGQGVNKTNIKYYIPHGILITLSIIGLVRSIYAIFVTGQIDSLVNIFWILSNLLALVLAIFFIHGRKVNRKSERVLAAEKCIIKSSNREITCETKDISEGGIAVELNDAEISEKEVTISLQKNEDKIVLKAKKVHEFKINKGTRYAFTITDWIEGEEAYLRLLYDRVPTLPEKLDASFGAFEQLQVNFESHFLANKALGFDNNKKANKSVQKEFSELDYL